MSSWVIMGLVGLVGLLCGAAAGMALGRRRHVDGDTVALVRRAAAGDLTVRVPDGDLGTPLNAVLERAAAVRDAAERAGGRLAGAAESSAESLGSIERTATGVFADVSAVSSGATELGASIEQISRNATEALSVAADAAQMSAQTTEMMTKLGDSSAQIGDVVQVITSIAEQTNLLALNATIEAARAGEMGKGFAVVASEVKDLAQETAKATKNITEQIAGIQHDTAGAVAAIRGVTEVIERINSYQATISGAVREQSATTHEMTRGITEATAHASEISAAVGAVVGRSQRLRAEADLIDEVLTAVSGAQEELRDAR